MRKTHSEAFTLLEMLTVIAVIAILAGLVLQVGGYATRKAALSRATGEIHMLASGCESYKSDNGGYPRDIATSTGGNSLTDVISPKQHFIPTDSVYAASSLFLYKELTGDKKGAGTTPDGVPDEGEQRYIKEMEPRILNSKKDPTSKRILEVRYLQDPFGFPYAYSTAAAKTEQEFQKKLKLGEKPTRPSGKELPGFNAGSFDLWSTGGSTPKSNPSSDQAKELEWAKWRKNW
jgi:prepilin-type N-terminal cleavage/methylation domain-containing protein